MKLRIILDTSVLISAIFFETGNEGKILDEVLTGRIILVSSLDTLQELRETLEASKFKLTPLEVLNVFQFIVSISEIVLAPPSAQVKCRDADDQKFLDCATGGDIDYLVTGDGDLLEIKKLRRTKITTARKLIMVLKRNPLFRVKPVRFKRKIRASEIDRFLYNPPKVLIGKKPYPRHVPVDELEKKLEAR